MSEQIFDTGVVSWSTFDALFENQSDFFRKLEFLIQTGILREKEGVVLDLISDLFTKKKNELRMIRENGFLEREAAGGAGVKVSMLDASNIDRDNICSEEKALVEKISKIRKVGGYHWENLRAIIEGTYLSIQHEAEPNEARD